MLTYVFGLISPEALTTVVRSCRCTLPVCTVTRFLLLWRTVTPTTIASRTTTPTPIAIFFQGFIDSRHDPGLFLLNDECRPTLNIEPLAGMVLCCGAEL